MVPFVRIRKFGINVKHDTAKTIDAVADLFADCELCCIALPFHVEISFVCNLPSCSAGST